MGKVLIAIALNAVVVWNLTQRLPERVATHFDLQGRPDSWASREAFFWQALLFPTVMGLFLAGLGWLITRLPNVRMNVPNQEFWSLPENKPVALAALRDWMDWFAAGMVVWLTGLFYLIYSAQVPSPRPLDMGGFGMWMVVFFVGSFAGVVGLMRRFRLEG